MKWIFIRNQDSFGGRRSLLKGTETSCCGDVLSDTVKVCADLKVSELKLGIMHRIAAFPLTGSMSSDKLLTLSEPQFSYQYNEGNAYLVENVRIT